MLSHSPLFAGLAAAQLDALIEASHLRELPAEQSLFRAGEPIREAHMLVSGAVERSTTLAGKTKKIIELVQSQQLLALGEIFGATTYSSSCETIAPCIVIAIGIQKLRAIIRQDLELSWRVIQMMARKQYAIEFDVTGYHYSLTGTQRVLDYLVELAGDRAGLAGETTVVLKTSKKIIAALIGMTPESFSRNLRLLSDSGVIVVEGRKVHIQNAALLNTNFSKDHQRVSFPRKPKTPGGKTGKSLSPGALVNLCGRHRVLSQRMAIAWAQIGRNVAAAKARVKLHQLEAEFQRNLARLKDLQLSAPEFTAGLAVVTDVWPRYRQALFDTPPDQANAARVFDLSEEILDATDRLTRLAENQAPIPAARHVNVAGRNRVLSQRISKLFLFREWASRDETIQQRLEASRREFESNLAALRETAAGVPELAEQLQEIAELWRKFEKIQQPDLAYTNKLRHALAVLAAGERLLRHVDTAVKLYERLAV